MQTELEDRANSARTTGVDAAKRLTLVSAAFLVVQVALTDYGPDSEGAGPGWVVVGLVLLWFVYRRRSRVARGVVIISAWVGVVVFALAALDWPVDWRAVLLALAYVGQAVPLMLDPVRRHVGTIR